MRRRSIALPRTTRSAVAVASPSEDFIKAQAVFCRRRHQAEKATASQVRFGQKRKSPRPAHQFAWPLKADKSPHQHQHGEYGKRSTLLKKSKREERKGSRGGNCLKGWMLAVPRCSGGFSSEHFLDRWAATAGGYAGPQRGKGRAVLERYLSILVPLLRCAQPVVTEGTDAWGVVHERNLS